MAHTADYEAMLAAALDRSEAALREAGSRIAWLETQLTERERFWTIKDTQQKAHLVDAHSALEKMRESLNTAQSDAARWREASGAVNEKYDALKSRAEALCVAVHESSDAEVMMACLELESVMKGG